MRPGLKKAFANLSLVLAGVLIACLIAEAALRLVKDTIRLNQYPIVHLDMLRAEYPAEYDSRLGWVPRPGAVSSENPFGALVSILPSGLRSNGPIAKAAGLSVLAVGDSFTFGDEVRDADTWPARLEARSPYRVLNAGVFGYGLDQSVLRAESLLDAYNPDVLVVGLVPDDTLRNQHDVFVGAAKPFFTVHGTELTLHNVPVPRRSRASDALRRVFGRSYLVHQVMVRLAPSYWLLGSGERHSVHSDGLKAACLLIDRVERISNERCIQAVLLLQYSRNLLPFEKSVRDYLLKWVKGKDILVVDMWDTLEGMKNSDPSAFALLYNEGGSHMSALGNDLAARMLAERPASASAMAARNCGG